MDRPRSRLTRLISALTTAYGVAATALLLAVAVLRDGSALTYAAALGAFWWVAPALALAPLALLLRRWGALATVLAPAVVAGSLTVPYLVPGRGDGDADLRVATFNTSGVRGLDALDDLVADDAPDVLLLQEIGASSRDALAERYPDLPYRSYGPDYTDPAPDDGGPRARSAGDAVLSRYPVVSVEPVPGLPAGARPADLVRLLVDDRELAVVSVHLASPCLFCTAAESRQNPAGDTAAAARVRVAEARVLAELARTTLAAGTPVVVGGDLNSSDLNEPLGILRRAGLVDVHRAAGTRPQLTRGSSPGYARVDVVLVAGLDPVADDERDPGGSDHSPVVADLAW